MGREPIQTWNDLPNKELRPENLCKNGIEFGEHDNSQEPAANIISLQMELLNFRNIVTVDDAEQISRYQIPDISLSGAGNEKGRQRYNHACLISKEASNMRKGEEALWVEFIKQKFFHGWGSPQKPKRPINYFCLTGGVAINGPSVQWNEAARHRDCPAKDILTVPKPDIYFGIQIHESMPEPSGFLDQALQNFTFDVLNSCRGLHYSPSKRCGQSKKGYHKHQVCFPFVVIEVKHESASNTERMQCIWTGNIRNPWDAAQLCSIVDKVAEWFFYIYRPWISTCLDQWKASEADKRLKTAYESFLTSRGLSQVDIGLTASNDSDGAAQLSTNPSTLFAFPYRESLEEVPPALFGGSHFGSRSTQNTPDVFMLGSRQPRSIWQQSDDNPGTTSKSKSFVGPFPSNDSVFGQMSSTERSSSSPNLKEDDRSSSKNNETLSSGGFGSSASKSNNRPYTEHRFGSTPTRHGFDSTSIGHGFGSTSTGLSFGSTLFNSDERPSTSIVPSASSFKALLGQSTTKSNEMPSVGASEPEKRPSTAGSTSPSSTNDERSSTEGSDSPKTDGRPLPLSMLNLSAPNIMEDPFSGKPFGDASPSTQSENERKPSNSRHSSSTSSEDNGLPSSIGALSLHSSEDVEPFHRSEASLIGRDENGNPGSEAARAGYYYRNRDPRR
ncbi:MAG: hypothetical protein Q9167_000836 [Letrouitia subvulpina]